MALLLEKYRKEITPALQSKFHKKNLYSLPKLEKIVVNMGLGDAPQDPKVMESAVRDLSLITGQRPIVTRARKSIAAFKLRQGSPIGCMVTLRGKRMYEFLQRLISVTIPRVRDFRGLSPRSFDGHGHYTFGLKEQTVFPEINLDEVYKTTGMNITLVIANSESPEESFELLRLLGMPFARA